MKFKILLLLATILLLSCEQNEKINSNSNQVLDHKILLDLFSEIETIAYSYTCEDEGNGFLHHMDQNLVVAQWDISHTRIKLRFLNFLKKLINIQTQKKCSISNGELFQRVI